MGCGASNEEKNPNAIETDFKHIGIPRLDDIFDQAKKVLDPAEEIRAGLQDDRDDMFENSNTDHLKDETQITVVNATQIWIWAMSA